MSQADEHKPAQGSQRCRSRNKDTVELPVLGLGAHAAQLLLVTAQTPGVVADPLRTQAAVAIQHLERNV